MSRPPSRDLYIAHTAKEFTWTGLPGWTVSGKFREQAGEWIIEELRISLPGIDYDQPEAKWTPVPGRGITSELLRSLNAAGLRVAIADHMVWASENAGIPLQIRPDAGDVRTSERTSPTRPRLPDAFLRQVAEAWIEEAQRGRGAYARMLARFSDRASSEQTVKGWLVACRDRGWLAPHATPNGGRGRLETAAGPLLLKSGYVPPTARSAQLNNKPKGERK